MITDNKHLSIRSIKPGVASCPTDFAGLPAGLFWDILRCAFTPCSKSAFSIAKTLDPVVIARRVAEENYDETSPAPAKPKKPRRKVVIADTEVAERAAVTPSPEDDIILFIDIEKAVSGLTDRQKEVYTLTMDGATREEIGEVLDVCPRRVGQIQAEIYAQIERALAVRLPGLTLPQLPLPDDDGRHRKVAVPEMLQIGAGDLAEPGLRRLLLVDLLLAHHRRQARTPLIQTVASIQRIKLDADAWNTCAKVLADDMQVDWVALARKMREHPARMGGLLLLQRVKQVVAFISELFSRGSRDNNSHQMQAR